ncbi:MAG: M20 family metallopeptidase [Tissierellia bacterium]|nr:M20 family metallopeptidase [Tissierellia bacterium]
MKLTSKEQNEALALLRELIKIPSGYFDEENIMNFTKMVAQNYNLPAKLHRYSFKPLEFEGLNLYGLIEGEGGPLIYLGGHLDTVHLASGWTKPPLGATLEEGRLYGTGALDMKAGCAAILYTLKLFLRDYPKFNGKILYHFASVEEGPYGLGTTFFIKDILKQVPDFALIAEPSSALAELDNASISLGAKGGYNYKVYLKGLSTHAATPEMGISAAEDAAKLVLELNHVETLEDPLLGKGASCVIALHSASGACSVPDEAEIEVFRHCVPGESMATIEAEIHDAIARAELKCSYTIAFREPPAQGFDGGFPPYTTDKNNPYVQRLETILKEEIGKEPAYTSSKAIGDFNLIGGVLGVPTVLYGPRGENIHSADEYVTISTYYETIHVLYEFLKKSLT